MTKNTAAARAFLGSLVLLIVALITFFVVLYPKKTHDVLPPKNLSVTDVDNQARRHAMRPTSTPAGRDTFNDVADVAPHPAGSQSSPAPGADANDEVEDADIERAINLVDAGNIQEAQQLLEGVLKRNPRDEQALVELAMIQLLDLKQTAQAIGYLERAIDVNPQNMIVMSELVSLYEDQGKVDEGLAFMQEVQSRNPQSPELAHGVGQMMTLAGRDQDAIAYYEKASQSGAYQVRAYRDLAEAYGKTGDPEKAIDSYGKAIQSQEQEIQELNGRGLPVQFAEERMAYTKMDMARELIRTGDIDRAEALLEEIGPILPGDESITALKDTVRRKKAG